MGKSGLPQHLGQENILSALNGFGIHVKNQLALNMEVYFENLNSILLVYISYFVPFMTFCVAELTNPEGYYILLL